MGKIPLFYSHALLQTWTLKIPILQTGFLCGRTATLKVSGWSAWALLDPRRLIAGMRGGPGEVLTRYPFLVPERPGARHSKVFSLCRAVPADLESRTVAMTDSQTSSRASCASFLYEHEHVICFFFCMKHVHGLSIKYPCTIQGTLIRAHGAKCSAETTPETQQDSNRLRQLAAQDL